MSQKSRERRAKNKPVRPDEYLSNGEFEMIRYGSRTIMQNIRSPEQDAAYHENYRKKYDSKYREINDRVQLLRDKVTLCDPYSLLMYLRGEAIKAQMILISEDQGKMYYSIESNVEVLALEYVQSILVSSYNRFDHSEDPQNCDLFTQIQTEFVELYKEFRSFYLFWAEHILSSGEIEKSSLDEIVEAQYLYWVRGKRFQVFELEPIKSLLPPHDDILMELFGVSSENVINGLDRLRYSLSKGYADALNKMGMEYDKYAESVDSGMSSDEAINQSNIIMSKLTEEVFGSALVNVSKITGWDARFIEMLSYGLGECKTFGGEEEFAGWPIIDLPVVQKPFITIGGTSYAFLYYALFDNIYRIIEKGIRLRKPTYSDEWKDKQARASEEMVKDLFLRLLPGADAHVGNYYPVNNSLKQMNENDIIIIYHNHLFVIEVKAGSFPITSPMADYKAYISAYHSLAEKADHQCSRTLQYIANHTPAEFYCHEKKPSFSLPALDSFDDVFTFSVTVENFNAFAAKAEKMNIISLKEDTIVISYDDLLVYADYFESPLYFLHYLKQRKAEISVPQFRMMDELDHLGLYIHSNLYTKDSAEYGNMRVYVEGFREPLNSYYNCLYSAPALANKPIQQIPVRIREIIDFLGANITITNIQLALFLLNMAGDDREEFDRKVNYVLKRQIELGKTVPIVASGEIKYCVFVTTPVIPFSEGHRLDYTYAVASRNEDQPVMMISLEYDNNERLVSAEGKKCRFSDVKEDDVDRVRRMGHEKARDYILQHEMRYGKIMPNDSCPCGSGKKFKKCCYNNFKSII